MLLAITHVAPTNALTVSGLVTGLNGISNATIFTNGTTTNGSTSIGNLGIPLPNNTISINASSSVDGVKVFGNGTIVTSVNGVSMNFFFDPNTAKSNSSTNPSNTQSATASNTTGGSNVTTSSIAQVQSGLVASDSLTNETKTQQQLQANPGYWNYQGDAPAEKAPYDFNRDTKGLHIGVQAPASGVWAGFFAESPNHNADLWNSVITNPVRTIPSDYYENGMYVQTANGNINYVTCSTLTNTQATVWAVISTTGNTNQATTENVLWMDNSANQPLTRDCTIITNGNNYLKVYLDGVMVYQNNTLNLQMPAPFNAYLEPETSYAGQTLVGTFQNYYVTLNENIQVTKLPSNAATVDLVNGSGTVLSTGQVSSGTATLNVGQYIFPLSANINVYDSSNNLIASSSQTIYGGSVYSYTGSSGGTPTVPGSPTGLTATAGSSQVSLSWTAPSSNGGSAITGYDIYRGTTSGSEGTTPVGTVSGSTLSYTDTGLTNGQTYYYKVTAVNSVGASASSNEANATPSISGVTVASVNQNNTPIYGFLTLLCSQGTSTTANGSNTCETGQSRYGSGYTTVTFDEPQGQTFGVDVYNNATCSFNHWSDNTQNTYRFRLFTATAPPEVLTAVYNCGVTTPQPPTGLTATTVSQSQINLSWTAPASNGGSSITGYEIERSTNGGTTWSTIQSNTGSTITTYSDTGLAASTSYTYRVSAINSVGTSSPSNTASATTSSATTAPQSPTGLAATAASSSQINLSWTAPSNNGGSAIIGYKIESSTNSGTTWSTVIANTGSTATTYSNTGLTPVTTYTYRVSAINSVGTSSPSNTASATTPLISLP